MSKNSLITNKKEFNPKDLHKDESTELTGNIFDCEKFFCYFESPLV